MRRRTLLLLGALVTFAPFAAAPLSADLPPGFAGLSWGDAPGPDMVLTGRAPFERPRRTSYYMKRKDGLELASVKVRFAEFEFRDDRLFSVFCAIGAKGDVSSLDALWGAHGPGPDGFPTWRGERTTAVLLRPESTGGHGPLIALFESSASDADISEAVRRFNLRGAGGLPYRGGHPEVPPPSQKEDVNDQFRLDLQREQQNSKVPK